MILAAAALGDCFLRPRPSGGRMAAQSDDVRVLRFSTDELPERDRLPIMREVHGRLSARVDIEPAPGVPLHYRVIARALPGLIVSLFSVSQHTVRRTRELLADGSDDVVLVAPPTAGGMVSQLGRELSPGAGEAVLMSAADVMHIDVLRSQCPMVTLSRRRLAPLSGARRRVHAARPAGHRSSTIADALRPPLRRPAEPGDPRIA
jgi:hypothetical protein